MKPTKLFLGLGVMMVLVALGSLGRAGPALARPPAGQRDALSSAVTLSSPGGTPRAARLESALLAEINACRAGKLIAPLLADAGLMAVARDRSADMVARDYFAHVTPDGIDVYAMLDVRGIPARQAGENLARNNLPDEDSPAHAAAGFMASVPHRLNVLDAAFTRAGVGVAIGSGGVKIYTVLFAGE